MDFAVSLTGVNTGFGFYSAAKFTSPELAQATHDSAAFVASSAAARGPLLNLSLGLDISGSMAPNMVHLVNAALATVDLLQDGASLRIVLFDQDAHEALARTTLTAASRETIKATIRSAVKNQMGATNIEAALTMLMSEANENQHLLLLTDGQANRGTAKTSKALISMARAMPAYSKYTVHCLGMQVAASTGLNGELLKDLAIDTDGSYELVHDAEMVAAFVGEVMASHLMARLNKCHVRLAALSGEASCVWGSGRAGFTLRADRPTTVVHKWAMAPAFGEPITTVYGQTFHGAAAPANARQVTLVCPLATPTPEAEAVVYKAIATSVLAGQSQNITKLHEELAGLVPKNALLAPILAIVQEHVPGAPQKVRFSEVDTSLEAYELCGLRATTSAAAAYLRNTSMEASQHQDGYDE